MNRALHPLPQRMTEQRCYRRSPVECQGLQPIRWRFSAGSDSNMVGTFFNVLQLKDNYRCPFEPPGVTH